MKIQRTKLGNFFEFPDMAALWRQSEAPETGAMGRESRLGQNASWYGTKTWEEAIRLARYGWPEGLKKLKPIMASVYDSIGSQVLVEHMVLDTEGEFPDVQAHVMGLPESMVRLERGLVERSGRIVRVVYNVGASSAVKPDVIMRRGAMAAAVCDSIGRAGYLCEVVGHKWYGRSANKTDPDLIGLIFPIKRADEPLNLERLAFCMAHPSMLRRILFGVGETFPEELRETFHQHKGGSYGCSNHTPEGLCGDLYFPRLMGSEPEWETPEAAEKETLRMLKDLGIVEA